MDMLLDSHTGGPVSIPAGSIYIFLNLFYLLFLLFLCAIFGGVMAMLNFQCRTVLHLDDRVRTFCADLLTFRMFCFTLCRLSKLFVFWDRMWNLIVSVADRCLFIYFVTNREHTVCPPVIIFEDTGKQLFT